MSALWLKGLDGDAERHFYSTDGITAANLADPIRYNTRTMHWDEFRVSVSLEGYISEALINSILAEMHPDRGRSKENAIQVTCDPVAEANTSAGFDSNIVTRLLQKLDVATGQLDFWSHMQLQDFRSDRTPSTAREHFKPALINHYYPHLTEPEAAAAAASSSSTTANKQSGSIRHLQCMVTGVMCNIRDIQAGHIIGCKHKGFASCMGIDHMSPRNGLLWLSTLESAWTERQCCFGRAPGASEVCFTLLDSGLSNMRLVDYPGGNSLRRDTVTALGGMTFGDLHMKPLLVQPLVLPPLSRAMCFMAHVYRKLARQDGVPMTAEAADDDYFDYWSDFDAKDMVVQWLVDSPV